MHPYRGMAHCAKGLWPVSTISSVTRAEYILPLHEKLLQMCVCISSESTAALRFGLETQKCLVFDAAFGFGKPETGWR